MAISALPTAPSTSDPTTFETRADALIAALPGFVTQANALETNVNAKEASAVAAAAAAAISSTSANAAVGAAAWVSGSYNAGAVAYSPSNFQSYRARTTGSKTTDPANDAANWAPLTVAGLVRIVSGADPAASAVAYQEWADIASGFLKIRNAANTAWITIGKLADPGIQSGNQTFVQCAQVNALAATFTPAVTALTNGMMLRIRSAARNTISGVTFDPNGLGPLPVVKGNDIPLEIGDIPGLGAILILVYDGAAANWKLLNPVTGVALEPMIKPISASVAGNALTITLRPTTLEFRSPTLSAGTVNFRTTTADITLTVPSDATLGTANGVKSKLAVVALDNVGTVELAVVNLAGSTSLTEADLMTTTLLGTASDSSTVAYSAAARSNLPYRVIGFVESTQATAGTWATAPSLVQGAGGNLSAMSTLGFGQTWQDVKASRASATNYTNTTGKPIAVSVTAIAGGGPTTLDLSAIVSGVSISNQNTYANIAGNSNHLTFIVPPGGVYSVTTGGSFDKWAELR